MAGLEKVMICIDFSQYSDSLIESAFSITNPAETEYIFFHVIHSRDIDSVKFASVYFSNSFSIEQYQENLITICKTDLGDLVRKWFPQQSSKVTVDIAIGIPYEEILGKARSENPDLLVMGNKGRTNLAGTLFGSNAERVFRRMPCPLLSVRFGKSSREIDIVDTSTSAFPLKSCKKIIAAIDFSPFSAEVLRIAGVIALRTKAAISAVNVINTDQIEAIKKAFEQQSNIQFSVSKYIDDEIVRRNRKLEDMLNQTIDPTISKRSVIMNGVPFKEILQEVENEKADLLVINSKGRSNLKEFFFGTTAEKAFRHCPVTVLSLNQR